MTSINYLTRVEKLLALLFIVERIVSNSFFLMELKI